MTFGEGGNERWGVASVIACVGSAERGFEFAIMAASALALVMPCRVMSVETVLSAKQ